MVFHEPDALKPKLRTGSRTFKVYRFREFAKCVSPELKPLAMLKPKPSCPPQDINAKLRQTCMDKLLVIVFCTKGRCKGVNGSGQRAVAQDTSQFKAEDSDTSTSFRLES